MKATAIRSGHYLNFYDNKFHVSAKEFLKGEVMEVNPIKTAATINSFQKLVEGGTSYLFIPEYAISYTPQRSPLQSKPRYTTFAATGAQQLVNMTVHAADGSGFAPTFVLKNGVLFSTPTLRNEGKKIINVVESNDGVKLYVYGKMNDLQSGQQYPIGVKEQDVKFGSSFSATGDDAANVNVTVKKRGGFFPFVSGVVVGAIATWFIIAYIVNKK